MIVNFNFDVILTTNFDRLIEKALDRAKIRFHLAYDDSHLKYFNEKTQPHVVKMHGSIDDPNSTVFALSSYKDYTKSRRILYSFLTGLFATRTILF